MSPVARIAAAAPLLQACSPAPSSPRSTAGSGSSATSTQDADAGIVGALFSLNLDGSVFQPCADDVGLVH